MEKSNTEKDSTEVPVEKVIDRGDTELSLDDVIDRDDTVLPVGKVDRDDTVLPVGKVDREDKELPVGKVIDRDDSELPVGKVIDRDDIVVQTLVEVTSDDIITIAEKETSLSLSSGIAGSVAKSVKEAETPTQTETVKEVDHTQHIDTLAEITTEYRANVESKEKPLLPNEKQVLKDQKQIFVDTKYETVDEAVDSSKTEFKVTSDMAQANTVASSESQDSALHPQEFSVHEARPETPKLPNPGTSSLVETSSCDFTGLNSEKKGQDLSKLSKSCENSESGIGPKVSDSSNPSCETEKETSNLNSKELKLKSNSQDESENQSNEKSELNMSKIKQVKDNSAKNEAIDTCRPCNAETMKTKENQKDGRTSPALEGIQLIVGHEIIATDRDGGIKVDETSSKMLIDNAESDFHEKEEPQLVTIVEQIDKTSEKQDVESKTEEKHRITETQFERKTVNASNNAKETDKKETDKKEESKVEKADKTSNPVKSEEDVKLKSNSTKSDAKLNQNTDAVDKTRAEQKPAGTISSRSNEGSKDDRQTDLMDYKEDVKKDSKDRPSKSYSAQRTANRSTRRGIIVDEPKDKRDSTNSKVSGTKRRDEKRNQEDDRRDRDRDGETRGKEYQRDRGKLKEAERYGDKSKNRDDTRRARKTTPPSQDGKRDKYKEESEREEAERKRREERRKKEEERKKKEEETKAKEVERKKQEEEDRKREEERKAEEEKRRLEEEQRRLEEEAVRRKEEEERHVREISVEAADKKLAKMELRTKNLAAVENQPDESFFTKLDSNLKKNTAFVKKLRVMTESQRLSLIKEFNTLNLTKYVGEVATSIAEAKLKMSDISCAIHICSTVHQRYADFSGHLLQAIQKVLPAIPSKKEKEKEEQKTGVFDSKIRVELRFLAELNDYIIGNSDRVRIVTKNPDRLPLQKLIVAGVFTEKEGLPLLNGVLSTILNSDKEKHSNLPIITSFTKHCGEDFAGFVPRKNRIIAEKFGVTIPNSEVFPPQLKNAYKNRLKDHYTAVTKYLLKKHKDLQKLERQNLRMIQSRGELSDERKKDHEETQALYQKLLMNSSTFADLIDEDMPDLPIDEKLQEANEMMAFDFLRADGAVVEFDFETSLWEDEDTRTFHVNLIDLRTMVPAILFKDSEKRAAPGDKSEEDLDKFDDDIQAMEVSESAQEAELTEEEDQEGKASMEGSESKGEEENAMIEEMESEEPETEEPDEDEEEEEEGVTSNVSMKVIMDAFLQKLPECVNRDFIDKEAVEFCMNLNNKTNRRKLVKSLFNVPRTRLDLLPFYSRLVATLYPCMPDIATDLVEKLKQEFRWHMRKKDQMKIESKIKLVRFMGELTKFKMCPKADTLQCLKQLLQVFQHHNIDMACNLLDVCGRYLYRSKDSHLRTKALLDLMMRKKNKMHMNERHSTMVENAFFYCNPPESKQMEQKVRPPLHEYIRRLLFKDLTKVTVEKVLKQMRKLPWDNLEIQHYAVKCLSSVWNVKYNNVHCMANLIAGLVLYRDYIGIQVVDAVLEDIRMGMEINYPKFNQRRVSVAKYLGELYNYRMIESSVIFKMLYSFIRFGVALDETPSLLDPPEHLFRIRLACTLLDTCGQFFDRGTSKKKLDYFLVYFQQYILFKRSLEVYIPETRPFPLDVDNAIADTFDSVRPKLKLFTTLEEANTAVEELEKEFVQKLGDVINLTRLSTNQPQQPGAPLSTISEADEGSTAPPTTERRPSFATGTEDEDDSDSDMDSEDVRRPIRNQGGSNPNSQSQGLSQNTEEEGYDYEDNLTMESAGENEDDDRVTVLTGGPKLVKCEEDEDFTSAFDKMMSENLQQRTIEAAKVPQLDISVPVHGRIKPKKPFDLFNPEVEIRTPTMNFTLMTRSGKKQQYHEFEVPVLSELAANLRNREMAEMAEKQRMKELTLNINDRQEEEDYQEMIASLQKPAMAVPGAPVGTPKERKSRFHHPKGAPDTDQIFHQTGNRKW